MAKRVYWVGLLILVRKLCKYWARYGGKMPSDLPVGVATAMVALQAACLLLEAYDNLNVPGNPSDATGFGG